MKVYSNDKELELIQAIYNEAQNKDFKIFVQWLADSLSDYRVENDTVSDTPGSPALSRNQGRCQLLVEILTTIGNCRALLEKYKTDPKLIKSKLYRNDTTTY